MLLVAAGMIVQPLVSLPLPIQLRQHKALKQRGRDHRRRVRMGGLEGPPTPEIRPSEIPRTPLPPTPTVIIEQPPTSTPRPTSTPGPAGVTPEPTTEAGLNVTAQGLGKALLYGAGATVGLFLLMGVITTLRRLISWLIAQF